ncbi:MAG: phosphate acyltransferase [Candidatus Gracilibacteria bacterium]
MEAFLQRIWARAKENPKRVVFAEGKEPRVLEAIEIIKKEGLAIPVTFDEPTKDPHFEDFVQKFRELRGTTEEEARAKMANGHYFATMMVQEGLADGMLAGPVASSKERILPALEIIKTKEKLHKVSGFFFMVLPSDIDPDAANGGVLLFADCAVNIEPDAPTLADIAIDSAETAKRFGINPVIAMLSFSTAGGSDHPLVKKIREAAKIVKARRPDLLIEGEMQVDAALMDKVGALKDPGSLVAGKANVLIFPDLESGNISYKLVERLAGAKAIGPILQGLRKPVNEVSRGSDVNDIVNLAAITSIEASEKF